MRRRWIGLFIAVLFLNFKIVFASDINTLKTEIYSKLRCCSCKDHFISCVCPEAKEMKAYTEALLDAGVGKESIYYKLAKKFTLNIIIDPKIKAGIEKRLIDEAGAKQPRLALSPVSFDFKELRKSQGKVKKTFKLSNSGTIALVIHNIKTSCGCVSVSLKAGQIRSPFFSTGGANTGWQGAIEPGKEGELEVVVDLSHTSVIAGRLIREARIFSNDPLYPETVITLTAEVRE